MLISPVEVDEDEMEPESGCYKGSNRGGGFCDVLSIAGSVFCSCLSLGLSCISSSLISEIHLKSRQKMLHQSMSFGNFLKMLKRKCP